MALLTGVILAVYGGRAILPSEQRPRVAAPGPSKMPPPVPRASALPGRPEQPILDQIRIVYSQKISPRTLQALGYFQRGIKAYTQAEYAQARAELSHPQIAQETALADYALFYLAASQEDPATEKKLLERFLTEHADSNLVVPGKVELARLEKEAGHPGVAAVLLEEPKVLADNPGAMMMLAESREELAKPVAAAALYERICREAPNSPEADAAAARLEALEYPGKKWTPAEREMPRVKALISSWRYKEALAALQGLALNKPPDLSMDEIYLRQGICYYHMKKYVQALESLKRVSAKKPDHHAESLYFQYQCQRRLANGEVPESTIQTLENRYPHHKYTESVLYQQAVAYERKNMPDRVQEICRRIVARFPEGAYCERARWKLVWSDYMGGRHAEAERGFLEHVRRFPDAPNNFAALYWAGRALEKLKNREAAAHLYRAVSTQTSNWYGQLAAKQLRKIEKNTNGSEAVVPPEIGEAIGRARLHTVTVPDFGVAEPWRKRLEKIRQLRLVKLDNLALKELEVSGGIPAARADFFQVDLNNERVDHLRWMRAFSKIIPNYYQYHYDELPADVWKILFPLDHWAKIKAEASKRKIDPYLIAALIRQESAYNPRAVSVASAMGLTQILPSTGRQLARQLGYRKFSPSRLHDPSFNIELGVHFFAYLVKRYDGKIEAALAAYNGGPSRADVWSKQYEDINEMVESIPLTETRDYVKRIVATRERYRQLYGM